MGLEKLFIVLLGLFALVRFGLLPKWVRRTGTEGHEAAIKNGAVTALLSYLAGLLFIGALTSGMVVVLILILERFGGTTPDELYGAITLIQSWRDWLKEIKWYWGVGAILLLALSLGIYSYRRGKIRMEKAFERAKQRERERLKAQIASGSLEDMPPTQKMKEIDRKMEDLVAKLQSLRASVNEDPSDNQEMAAALQQAEEQLKTLEEKRQEHDIERRLIVGLDPEDVQLPAPVTRWEKIQTFFISQGLLSCLDKGTRTLVVASLLLVIPSLIGICSQPAADRLQMRIVQLDELFVQASAEEALSTWKNAKNGLGLTHETDLSAPDEQALDELARLFEDELAAPPQGSAKLPSAPFTSSYEFRSQLLRDRLLTRGVSTNNAQLPPERRILDRRSSISDAEGLKPREKALVAFSDHAMDTKGPRTDIGKKVRQELGEIARRSPREFMQHVRSGIESFQRPASSDALQRTLFSQILNQTAYEGAPELGDLVSLPRKEDFSKGVRRMEEARAGQFLETISQSGNVTEAVERVRTYDPKRPLMTGAHLSEVQNVFRTITTDLPNPEIIAEKFHETPPRVYSKAEPQTNERAAVSALEKLESSHSPGIMPVSQQSADALARYEDWFPGQVRSATTTPRTQALTAMAQRAGPMAGSVRAVEDAGRMAFQRGGSFARLRGFSRIGGVLIGREPSDPEEKKLDIRDIRWETVDDLTIRIKLVSADGRQYSSIPHRKSVVWQAMLYAADGRPVTVTMTTAKPLPLLRIQAHPIIEDTPLGYRMIELDRFVDKYTSGEECTDAICKAREEAQNIVEEHQALYTLAWAARILALNPEDFDGHESEIENYQLLAESIQDDLELELETLHTLKHSRQYLDKPDHSPLTVKKEYYDPDLVRIVVDCAQRSDTLKAYRDELAGRMPAEASKLAASYSAFRSGKPTTSKSGVPGLSGSAVGVVERASDDPTHRWLSLPPTFEVWSGVREREFSLKPEEILMQDSKSPQEPLVFMLQVAFTSGPDPDENEMPDDMEPWEFPSLQEKIHNGVSKFVGKDSEDKQILADAGEFTMLQRLFRIAFAGRLGEGFPLEKLNELSEAVASPSPPKYRTLRWNASPQQLSIVLAEAMEAIEEAENELEEAMGDSPKSSFSSRVLTHVRHQKDIIAGLEREGREFLTNMSDLLSRRDKGSQQWQDQWDHLWQDRRKTLTGWENKSKDLEEDGGLMQEARNNLKRILEREDPFSGLPSDRENAAEIDLRAARTLRSVKGTNQFTTIVRLYNAFRIDVDEKQVVEEMSGMRKLPPSLH